MDEDPEEGIIGLEIHKRDFCVMEMSLGYISFKGLSLNLLNIEKDVKQIILELEKNRNYRRISFVTLG